MIADARRRGEPAGMHPRTYYPLAYAAVPAEELLGGLGLPNPGLLRR